MSDKELAHQSVEYRRKILKYIHQANAGHTGGSLSCIDILNVLYNHTMNVDAENFNSPDRDRYIQSKGHTVEALYVVLASKGFFPETDLETLCQYKSHYIGHPTRKVHGVEQNTGALGHGLSLSVGTAIAGKLDKKDYRVFTLLGDGELPEGSNWEAALFIAHHNLHRVTLLIDRNDLQGFGRTGEVANMEPFGDKFRAFGFEVLSIDGHDPRELHRAVTQQSGLPKVIIMRTVKGHGVSFMEDKMEWHYLPLTKEQYRLAVDEVERA